MFCFKLNMKINTYQTRYKTFTGKKENDKEKPVQNSFAELLKTITFDKQSKGKMSLEDALAQRIAEQKAEEIATDSTINFEA